MGKRLLLVTLLLLPLRGFAEEDAKAVFDRATALFALHQFSEAAVLYEKAFKLRPDPAILYNAAQSHRLAGQKTRALELYQSLLRLYGQKLPNRAEIHEHVRQLNIAIEADRRAASAPPVTPQPRPPEATPPTTTAADPVVVAAPPPPAPKRRWLWPVVGVGIGLVVAGVTVGIVLGTSQTVDPMASFGTARGN